MSVAEEQGQQEVQQNEVHRQELQREGNVAVQVQQLSHSYSQGGRVQQVLCDASFTLRRGETVALLGRSGCGKTTLLNLLSGIDAADTGRIFIGDTELGVLGEPRCTLFRRRHIGFIYQFFNLVPTLTAAENIALVLELNGTAARPALEQAKAALRELDLHERADHFPSQLSGGEQQRVAIVRALIHAPALVLADEPTGNLDARSGEQVLHWMRHELSHRGCTTLLVTHSLSVAQSADRILTLEDGVVQERVGEFAW